MIVMEEADMKLKGFSLIELMVVLAIITIIATASVPQIQLWVARNRGNQVVSQLISDFSRAKAIAGYTVNDAETYIGVRPQTAIMFRKTNYSILQKNAVSGSWSDISDTRVKRVVLPRNVDLVWVNNGPTNDGTDSETLVFTPSGKLKNSSDNTILTGEGDEMKCGDVTSPLTASRVFRGIVRSMIKDDNGVWYRIEFDMNGQYFVCTINSSAGDAIPNFSNTDAVVLEI